MPMGYQSFYVLSNGMLLQQKQANNYRILQGFLENSNVNPILEMVKLIEAHRAHEVYSNLIRALDQVQEKVSNSLV